MNVNVFDWPTMAASLLAAALVMVISGCSAPQRGASLGPPPFGEAPATSAEAPREFTLAELRSALPQAPVFDVPEPPRLPVVTSLPRGWVSDHVDAPIGPLRVYHSALPEEGTAPVVVWAHAGIGGVDESLLAASGSREHPIMRFVAAGAIVVVPTWRGEHDNPGRYEAFYGEVDDLLAAITYARALPGVDPRYVVLAGHSEGASLAFLAAVTGVDVAGVLVMGAAPDMCMVAMNGGYGFEPYRLDRQDQCIVRSANMFVSHIRSPTWYAENNEGPYLEAAEAMEADARAIGVPFRAQGVAGVDHAGVPEVVVPIFAAALRDAFVRDTPLVLPPEMLSNAPAP